MAHEQMFDDDDPLLHRVRDLALALPGAQAKVSHGRPAFYTTKVFAYYGGSQKLDGIWVQHPRAIMVLPGDDDDARALGQDPRTWVPGYLGPSGWLGLDVDADSDWAEVRELLTASFIRTAPRTLVARLPTP